MSAFDLQDLLDRVVATLFEVSRAEACSIWLIDPDGKVRIKAAEGYHKRLLANSPAYQEALRSGRVEDYTKGLPIPAEYGREEGVTGQIAKTGIHVLTTGGRPHAEAHPQWKGKYDRVQWPRGGVCKSFFGAPLKVQERTIGVLKIENKLEPSGELAAAFNEEDEEVLTILANVIVVTFENQRLAEERRKQAEQAWRTISARLAHKIGNQNFATKGLLSILQKLSLPADGDQLVARAWLCCEGIDSVVNEAKKFSGPLAIQKKPRALGKFVEVTVRSHPIADWRAEYEFSHEDPTDGPVISLDEAQMRHVLMELLENSQGFKKENARITIHTGRAPQEMLTRWGLAGECALINYADNGPGIPDHHKEIIFEPFVSFRQGSGLGLSIVRQIVEAHGGRIKECGKYGEGARFLICLPFQTPDHLP
ncbi:MAG: ATP-binding protein [Verrucomicrobiota bacterium]